MNLSAIAAVAGGAAIGGASRYIVGWLFVQRFGPGFPWGTLAINLSGSFLIAVVAQLALTRAFGVTPMFRIFAATGILGGYTTFSTFSLDCLTLISGSELVITLFYALLSVCGGLFAAYLGQTLTRMTTG